MAGIADILAGLNGTFSDPSSAPLTGFAQGLLQASAPHMLTPVSMGQALGMGSASSQQYQSQALQNALQRVAVPFKQMQLATFAKALKTLQNPKASPEDRAAAQALAANLVSPGMGAAMLSNSPAVQGAKTQAVQAATPHPVGPSQRLVTGSGAPIVGAQGSLPTATAQNPSGAIAPLPGAIPSIAQTAGAQAGGAAAASFPYQQELKASGYFKRSPGEAGAFNLPQPPLFNPAWQTPPQPPAQPSPAALQAAQVAARQRQLGATQGAPPPATPAPQTAAPPVPAAPAASGGGLVSPGMTPSQITGQQTTQKEATQQLAADITGGQEAQQQVANLEELNAIAGRLTTGPGTEGRIAAQKALASVGGALGFDTSKLGSITDAQVFRKTAINFALQAVSSADQHAYNAMETVLNAVPALKNTNLANAVVTGSLLASRRYAAAKGQFASTWQQQNGMGYVQGKGSADAVWTKQAPFLSYFMAALPPEAQTTVMKAAQKNLTLRHELTQARNALPWLSNNGYL